MRKVNVKSVTLESFQPYGSFAQMINPDAPKIGAEPIEFYRDMVQVDLGRSGTASFSTCRVMKRPAVVDTTEYHSSCGEGILPLDGDVMIHVAPATPDGEAPLDAIEVFLIPKGMMVSLRPGVWHHAPFAFDGDCANVLVVLPERTYANDCKVHNIPKENRTEIQGH